MPLMNEKSLTLNAEVIYPSTAMVGFIPFLKLVDFGRFAVKLIKRNKEITSSKGKSLRTRGEVGVNNF